MEQLILWVGKLRMMVWQVFDKIIPEFISNNLPGVLSKYMSIPKSGYILHAGGMKIIQSYEKILKIMIQ